MTLIKWKPNQLSLNEFDRMINGTLQVTLPKAEEVKPESRSIKIN